jgi:hypothetical protein
MIKLLAVTPMEFDGTSYYRAHGVFPNLVKKMGNQLQVTKYKGDFGQGYNWSDLINFDILFLQRPSLDASKRMRLTQYCKDIGIKVWIDFDDNLFSLPRENRMFEDVTPQIKKDMIALLKLADVVTVSTKALKEFFATIGVVADVVPNALNTEVTPMAGNYNFYSQLGESEQLLWRGSETHQGDIYYHINQIFHAIDNRLNSHWHWMGYDPWYITNGTEANKYTTHKSEDIMVYFKNLRKLRPNLVHFPLMDNSLNRCKSNIAWLESTSVGSTIIAPDWEEWQKPGVLNYKSFEDYGNLLMRSIDGDEKLWKASRDYIMENLTLDVVNWKRVDIIERLMDNTPLTKFYMSNLPDTMIE